MPTVNSGASPSSARAAAASAGPKRAGSMPVGTERMGTSRKPLTSTSSSRSFSPVVTMAAEARL